MLKHGLSMFKVYHVLLRGRCNIAELDPIGAGYISKDSIAG